MNMIMFGTAAVASLCSAIASYLGLNRRVALIGTIVSVAAMTGVFISSQSTMQMVKAQAAAAMHSLYGGL